MRQLVEYTGEQHVGGRLLDFGRAPCVRKCVLSVVKGRGGSRRKVTNHHQAMNMLGHSRGPDSIQVTFNHFTTIIYQETIFLRLHTRAVSPHLGEITAGR
jgi:hypothetical protein